VEERERKGGRGRERRRKFTIINPIENSTGKFDSSCLLI
jgi:hypothetical protein